MITIENDDFSFPCRKDEMVFHALKRSKSKRLSYGCYGGGCGICKAKVVSGTYEIAKKMSRAHVTEEEEKMGYVLLCRIMPTDNITIFFNHKEE